MVAEASYLSGLTPARPPRAQRRSVPTVGALEAPRTTGGAVPVLHVLDAPGDLGRRVGAPVVAVAGHLAAGQRLRDAVRARGGVRGVDVPVALADDDVVEALVLVVAVVVLVLQDLLGDVARIRGSGLVAELLDPGRRPPSSRRRPSASSRPRPSSSPAPSSWPRPSASPRAWPRGRRSPGPRRPAGQPAGPPAVRCCRVASDGRRSPRVTRSSRALVSTLVAGLGVTAVTGGAPAADPVTSVRPTTATPAATADTADSCNGMTDYSAHEEARCQAPLPKRNQTRAQ